MKFSDWILEDSVRRKAGFYETVLYEHYYSNELSESSLSYINRWCEKHFSSRWVYNRGTLTLASEEQLCLIHISDHSLERCFVRNVPVDLICQVKRFIIKKLKDNHVTTGERVFLIISVNSEEFYYIIKPEYVGLLIGKITVITCASREFKSAFVSDDLKHVKLSLRRL